MRWLQANPSELTELVHLENESDLAEVLPSGPLGISPALDDAWRAQISNTKLYSDFCTRHFGSFVHHEDDSAIEEEDFEDSYEATIKLLYLVFGPSGECRCYRWLGSAIRSRRVTACVATTM